MRNSQPMKTKAVTGICLDVVASESKVVAVPYELGEFSKMASSVRQVR